MTTRRPLAGIVLLLSLCAPPARAHEYWLVPSSYRAAAGDSLTVAAFVGTGFRGEPRPYAASRVLRFEARTSSTRDLAPLGANGDLTFARFAVPDNGGTLLIYRTNFVPIELPADEFDRYLELEGLDAPRAARAKLGPDAGPGRERYARNAKVWVAGTDRARLTRAAGLPLEIVPLDDPATSARLKVRVLYNGRPLAGALLRAWRQPLAHGFVPLDGATRDSVGPTLEVRTAKNGEATLAIGTPGEWLINTAHMVPSGDRAAADWESQWSAFTFVREPKTP